MGSALQRLSAGGSAVPDLIAGIIEHRVAPLFAKTEIIPVTIFHRSLTREFAGIGVAVCSVLVAISATYWMVRLLGRAAGGSIEPEAVLVLLGFSLVYYLPVLLSVSLFVAVLLALTRAHRDSEMQVWFSTGLAI